MKPNRENIFNLVFVAWCLLIIAGLIALGLFLDSKYHEYHYQKIERKLRNYG